MMFIIDTKGKEVQTAGMRTLGRLVPFVLLMPLATGCGENLIDPEQSNNTTGASTGSTPGGNTGAQAVESPDPKVKHAREGSGFKTKLDAADQKAWVYLDLDDRAYPAANATEEGAWDIAFRRVKIRLNGGISGKGNVGGKIVEGADAFDKTKNAPGGAFEQDKKGEANPDTDPFGESGLVFGLWYNYDQSTHAVTPKARTYVVQSNKGAVFKVEILNYYNEAKSSGHYTVRWAPLPPQNQFYNYAMDELIMPYNQPGARILAVIPHPD